jgi:hypothetical protein
MDHAFAFALIFIVTAVGWVLSLVAYSALIGGFDFGRLSTFVLKSVIQVAAVTAVLLFVPWGGLVSIAVWWLGAIALFGQDLWEAKMLVLICWLMGILVRVAVLAAIASSAPRKDRESATLVVPQMTARMVRADDSPRLASGIGPSSFPIYSSCPTSAGTESA